MRGGGSAPTSCFTSQRNCAVAGRPGEVRRRFVEDRHFQPFGVGLPLARDVDEHAIALAVAVGVELGLDPQRLPDPLRLILERGHDLRLAIDKHRLRRGRRRRALLRHELRARERGERKNHQRTDAPET